MGRDRTNSLSQDVYIRLKQDILNLEITPGTFLTEHELAIRFHTSKTPVREALTRLASEELIAVKPHKGYLVTDITYGELLEIFQFREILEVSAVELAMQNVSGQEMERLEALAEVTLEGREGLDIARRNSEINNQFHLYLVSLCKNALFGQTYEQLLEKVYRVLLRDSQVNRADAMRAEHMELVSYMKQGNTDAACAYMRGHIRRTKERVLRL